MKFSHGIGLETKLRATKHGDFEMHQFAGSNILDNTPIQPRSVGLITFNHVLHHVHENSQMELVQSVRKAVKKNGCVFVKEHDSQFWQQEALLLYVHFIYDLLYPENVGWVNRFKSATYWQSLFECNGFETLGVEKQDDNMFNTYLLFKKTED